MSCSCLPCVLLLIVIVFFLLAIFFSVRIVRYSAANPSSVYGLPSRPANCSSLLPAFLLLRRNTSSTLPERKQLHHSDSIKIQSWKKNTTMSLLKSLYEKMQIKRRLIQANNPTNNPTKSHSKKRLMRSLMYPSNTNKTTRIRRKNQDSTNWIRYSIRGNERSYRILQHHLEYTPK